MTGILLRKLIYSQRHVAFYEIQNSAIKFLSYSKFILAKANRTISTTQHHGVTDMANYFKRAAADDDHFFTLKVACAIGEFVARHKAAFAQLCLQGKKVVIVGCGAQGLNQGLNMRDSGLDISYALRKGADFEAVFGRFTPGGALLGDRFFAQRIGDIQAGVPAGGPGG
jgi:hypothetical protein